MNDLLEFAGFLGSLKADAAAKGALTPFVCDIVGSMLGAMVLDEGKALVRLYAHLPSLAHSSVPELLDAVAFHCALTRVSDTDDIHLPSLVTPGSVAVTTALVLGAVLPCDEDDIAAAMLAGYEAMIMLGRLIDGPNALYSGIWPTYFAAPFGAAAVASRLLKLDTLSTANALALALSISSPNAGSLQSPSSGRWWLFGLAARSGVAAAFSARDGMEGDHAIFNGEPFWKTYSITPRRDVLRQRSPNSIIETLSSKPWCAARQTMAATTALLRILKNGARADAITEIRAYVPPPMLRMVSHGTVPGDRGSFLTSLPFQFAIAALTPEANLDLRQTGLLTASLSAFMDKVTIAGDETLLARYPSQWEARVEVRTPQGWLPPVTVSAVEGDPGHRLSPSGQKAKFERLLASVLAPDDSDTIWDLAANALSDKNARDGLVEAMQRHTRNPHEARGASGPYAQLRQATKI